MVRRSVAFAVGLVLLAAFPPVPAAGPACEGLVFLPHVGLACPVGDGLYEVFDPAGRSVATTHGIDLDPAPPVAPAAARAPVCVPSTQAYRALVVYARAADDTDRYSTMAATLRGLVETANGHVYDAALATGGLADIRVQCTAGVVDVASATLPTPVAATTFATIVSDLNGLGYNDPKVKYWVWFDENTCSCGIGHLYDDDRLLVANANNGNAQPMFAVTFGIASTRVWLHEFSHNMGAVQDSAPHSTGAGHCTDGRDTMCYDDGGPNSGGYTTTACAAEVYDCGKDDYFHRAPPAGSYLATHWNIGNEVNRFLRFVDAPPRVDLLSCPSPIARGMSTTCSFRALDDSPGAYFTVQWGDGASSRVPESGTVVPGVVATAAHTWTLTGPVTVTATATDSVGQTGAPAAVSLTVAEGPLLRLLSCPASVAPGATATCTFRADDDGPVRYAVDWGDGTVENVPPTGTVAPGVDRSAGHVYATGGIRTVRVTASDTEGHTSAALTAPVRALAAPVMTALTCPAMRGVGVPVMCSFTATDVESAQIRYDVAWGDGVVTPVPASGFVAPGASRQAAHAYASAGTYIVSVTATDDGGLVSAPRTVSVNAVVDTSPPTIVLVDPVPGRLYVGCTTNVAAAGAPPTYLARGCVRATVTDALSGVASVQVRFDGAIVGTYTAPTSGARLDFDFPVDGVSVGRPLTVHAVDGSGNAGTTVPVLVATVAP